MKHLSLIVVSTAILLGSPPALTRADQQFNATRSKYVPMFEKVISAKKTALWFQIDRRLDLLINLQLAANIPVVNTGQ